MTDIFTPYYANWLDLALARMKPIKATSTFNLIQMIYDLDKANFVVISSLHSNDMKDPLHFSVCYTGKYKNFTLHINGFYKSTFIIQSVTCITSGSVTGMTEPEVICEFHTYRNFKDSGSEGSN